MSLADTICGRDVVRPHKPRREKMFGEGRAVPLDRNAKARIVAYARALSHRTEPGKHYGVLTDKFLTVLRVLLWDFHNAGNGRCFPSYETHRRARPLRPHDGLSGHQRAGARRHPHLGQPHRSHPGVGAGPVRPGAEPLARDPHQQSILLRRSANVGAAAGFF